MRIIHRVRRKRKGESFKYLEGKRIIFKCLIYLVRRSKIKIEQVFFLIVYIVFLVINDTRSLQRESGLNYFFERNQKLAKEKEPH